MPENWDLLNNGSLSSLGPHENDGGPCWMAGRCGRREALKNINQTQNNMITKNPRLSLNKMAEYMTADSLRRRQIIKDAKYPKNYKSTRYSDARDAIKAYITSGYDEDIINKAISLISKKPEDTDFQIDDKRNSIVALENVLAMDLPELGNHNVSNFSSANKLVTLSGLDISVFPDLIIENLENKKIGAFKIHISKSNMLSQDSLGYSATMLKYFYLINGKEEKMIDHNLCISYDVFAAVYRSSPSAYKQSINRISSAAEEIVSRWPNV